MKVFLAVVSDLIEFALSNFIKKKKFEEPNLKPPKGVGPVVQSPYPKQTYLPQAINTAGERYFVIKDRARVFIRPVIAYDGVLFVLSYGQELVVRDFVGRFAVFVGDNGEEVFILKDDLTVNEQEIYPNLESGKIYLADNPEVKKLRRFIADEFTAKELYLPLQDSELVTYLLKREGRALPWPRVRPRVSGSWQQILKGAPGLNISVSPLSGSIMEYQADELGHLAYTKAVDIDEGVIIFSVGRQEEGKYLVEHLKDNEWRILRPVWISLL